MFIAKWPAAKMQFSHFMTSCGYVILFLMSAADALALSSTNLLLIYHTVAGIFYFLAEAGAVSALPAHLMSDHVFLGSSLVAMLSAEAVLLAKDIRCY